MTVRNPLIPTFPAPATYTRELSTTTLPLANSTLQDLRRTSAALRQMTEQLQSQGAGSLIGGNKLPEYEP